MTRTNKTAAAAPAPGNGPRKQPTTTTTTGAAPVKVTRIDPAKLATMTPEELAAALQAATVTKTKPARTAAPRVSLSTEALAAFDAMGWKAPRIDTDRTFASKPRERFNSCKGSAVYTVTLAALQAGPITLTDLARLWLASGNPTKNPGQIVEQLAIRAQRPIRQTGETLTLA